MVEYHNRKEYLNEYNKKSYIQVHLRLRRSDPQDQTIQDILQEVRDNGESVNAFIKQSILSYYARRNNHD